MLNTLESAPSPLGRRQRNILTGLLRGVPVLGHGDQVMPLTEPLIQKAYRTVPSPLTVKAAAEANRLRPRVVNAVIGPEARRTGYIHGLPHHGVQPLLHAAGEAARHPLTLRIVYGASTRIPLRALSYVLPAVHAATRLGAAGYRRCHIQVVLADSIGTHINALDARAVHAETTLLAGCLNRMLSSLSPGAFSVYRAEWIAEMQHLADDLIENIALQQRDAILDRLRGKGRLGQPEKTLLYAAAHVLLHDQGRIPLALMHGTATPAQTAVIDMGGIQERHFHAVRHEFAEDRRLAGPGALILTRHHVPPYTMARNGDITLRACINGDGQDGEPRDHSALHDVRYLRKHVPSDILEYALSVKERYTVRFAELSN